MYVAQMRRLLRDRGYLFCDDVDKERMHDDEPEDLLEDTESTSLLSSSVEASSEDQPDQSIDCALKDDRTFWSSKGTPEEEKTTVEEHLTFRMKGPLCVVKSVEINVFRAEFQWGGPVYPPFSMTIYTGPSPERLSKACTTLTIKPHESPQVFALPFSCQQALGQYIQFRFHGKQQIQATDGMYYIAVRYVQAYGMELPIKDVARYNLDLKSDWSVPANQITLKDLKSLQSYKDNAEWEVEEKTPSWKKQEVDEIVLIDFPEDFKNS